MWQIHRLAGVPYADVSSSTQELLRSINRATIVTIGAIYLAWHIVATVLWPRELGPGVWLLSVAFTPLFVTALRLVGRRPLLAQAIWQIGLATLIALALMIFQQAELAFFYALLPLLAVVTFGWQAALVVGMAVMLLAIWFTQGILVPTLPPAYAAGVVVGAAITGVLGWSSMRTLTTVAQWSFFNYSQAQAHLEEVQQNRARLAMMLKDLDHAYYRLERSNTALVAARKAAEEAERFKAEFVANVSHELRTPLNLIVGFSEVIITSPESYGTPLPGPYRRDLNAIYRSAQHLLGLVDDVLDLARIESGKIALVREEVDLPGLIAEVADTMGDYIRAKGLELRIEVAQDLPRLQIDRLRIRQVLLNLLANAARFTEHGAITIAAQAQADAVLLQVRDTGRGIPAPDLPMIFEEFRSTEQPVSTWHSGTGLGLPISKKFVTLHQGQMGVESTLGAGTTFWLTLPLISGQSTLRAAGQSGPWQPLVPLNEAERMVVVVHDDPRVIGLLQRHLSSYRVVGAASWAEGVGLAGEVQALALLANDSDPPGQLPNDLPVLRCPLPSSRHAALAMGANELLSKPVARQDLLAAIERLQRPIRQVLIVDDEPKMVQLFQRMLHSFVPTEACLAAYNGIEAQRILQVERPDLILLDLNMPEADGQSVLDHLMTSAELAQIPVIIVSGQGQTYLNVPLHGALTMTRAEGFGLGELMLALEALFNVLGPGWRALDARGPAPATAPAE